MPASADEFLGRAECGTDGGPGCDVSAESGGGNPDVSGNEGEPIPEAAPEGTGSASSEPACEVDGLSARCSATVGGGADEAEEEVDFEALAYAARAAFQLSSPEIAMSPSADAPVLVRVPVWMWISSDAWQEETATASVPGGSVTVTATPTSVSWSMGDGTTVECEGPGTAYDPDVHDPAEPSPDCGHTFTSISGGYEVTASLSWQVEWSSSDGEGGTFPALTTQTSTTVRVVESSGVVT
ncbi:hypothetical protein [Nocardiopsis synnemataformans]|uniref:hypothetical protein n=1 Tax=Nocardiopsis synnemataformans TaxID=61305 RepID=UPI003EBDBBBC